MRRRLAVAAVAVLGAGAQLFPAAALADPILDPRPKCRPHPARGFARRATAAQRHLQGPRGRDIARRGRCVQDRRHERQQRTADAAARQHVRGQHRDDRPEAGGHGACRSSGRTDRTRTCEILVGRPDRRARPTSSSRRELLPPQGRPACTACCNAAPRSDADVCQPDPAGRGSAPPCPQAAPPARPHWPADLRAATRP